MFFQGFISKYLVDRYGFAADCRVIAFTGDNPGQCIKSVRKSVSQSVHLQGASSSS